MTNAGQRRSRTSRIVLVIALMLASVANFSDLQEIRAVGPYDLRISISSNRSNSALLEGRTVAGNIYVFTAPDTTDIARVRFWLDNPAMSGSPSRTENSAPYDFNGGTVTVASAFDTRALPDGSHSITAAVDLSGGVTEVITATFIVQNQSTGTGAQLTFSPDPIHVVAPLNGQPIEEPVTLTTADGSAATFTVTDNVSWLSVKPNFGATPATVNLTIDPESLVAGSYNATVTGSATGYTSGELSVVLFIPDAGVDQVHLSWVDDPATTMTVIWRTQDINVPSEAQYRLVGNADWTTITGAERPSGTAGTLHEVTFTSLTPNTAYEYRVRESASEWSGIETTRTAPAPGPADFDFVYVADTGLVGRSDGLATGTQQVIDEIASIDPLLVLGGGDYSYFNTDKRFGTLNNTTDVWFNQMQPILSRSPIMPTYGNHEDSLHENFYDWSARFATPPGFDERRNYSFDIGDVHFVSIYAVFNGFPLPDATVAWIRQDVQAAQARGQRWIIPYFHVSPFSDGTNHPTNLALRRQLGPLFEELGVKVAIASHDQSYERTFPLIGVPSTNMPTSTGLDCYTLADGVTWLKVSPGGKLSNISGGFSPWASDPPPPWTAVRDNTMHHFLHGTVTGAGTLEIEILGLAGDGTPPISLDSFRYTTGSCSGEDVPPLPPSSVVATDTTDSVVLDWADNGESDLAGYNVYVADNASGPFTKLNTVPLTSSAYDDTAAPEGVTAYYYVTAVDTAGHESSPSNVVSATRGLTYSLQVSTTANRSNPISLDAAVVTGNVFVFTAPDTADIARVRFWLDDPAMTGSPWRTENSAPYDFNGGSVTVAAAFDTRKIADGTHTITAQIQLDNATSTTAQGTFTVSNSTGDTTPPSMPSALVASGSTTGINLVWDANGENDLAGYNVYRSDSASGTFTRLNTGQITTSAFNDTGAPSGVTSFYRVTAVDTSGNESSPATAQAERPLAGSYELVYSKTSNRSGPLGLNDQTVSGNIYVFTTPDTPDIVRVRFFLDDPGLLGTPRLVENNAPYDFAGGTVQLAKAFDTRSIPNGTHTITAEIVLPGGVTESLSATFIVAN